jgi:hypothetical protein
MDQETFVLTEKNYEIKSFGDLQPYGLTRLMETLA